MLTLKRLEIEGFGPFAEKQVVTFPKSHGVTVVYGDNMRGKTSLLNAIRYAFFGKVLGRGARERRLHTITNRARAADGKFGFSVALAFDYDETEYELIRSCRAASLTPANDGDYVQEVLLRRGRTVLGPQEQEKQLHQIFPHEVSRFFLFDGELLQEYEELLINESDTGRSISEAIERILGMPILKKGRAHLTKLMEDADKLAAKEASKNQQTKALGASLQMAAEQREAHQNEIRRLQHEIEEYTERKSELEELMKSNQKYRALLDEKERLETELDQLERQERARRGDLQRAMAEAWKSVLFETVRSARAEAQVEAEKDWAKMVLMLGAKAATSGHCDVCGQDVAEAARAKLRGRTASVPPDGTPSVSPAITRLADLGKFHEADNSGEIRELWTQVDAMRLRQAVVRDRLADLRGGLTDSDETTLRRSGAEYAEVIEKLGSAKNGLREENKKVEEIDQNIQRIRKQLEPPGNPERKAWQLRASVLGQASAVFAAAIDRYKSELRTRVEETASELFLTMTTEKRDFARLSINESYGLHIVHRDGRTEDSRSAGAEHVVALALMGSLQRNAPLRGPIVMDSLFGRLDGGHRKNVIAALPEMAEQVILLVHEAEVSKPQVRALLGGRLLKEYELQHVSARRTNIAAVR
ncbi:AAA family ATPase [Anaeromyxobacter diazotrophicus]|uniref:Rad50/SbcC-type AAA domain-containing protein n=1 Tax=Anaeromyxobacter diazotrophicus TaxID=2590199 RepID=A0A7I9VJR7_9BACT|nr:AAA family ATPase [Anaeromyxobacter diazotrophicus]GEJ56642.1 hypothetical protein AMYX_13830 [Anaeromyxobacter diazotrophicus]